MMPSVVDDDDDDFIVPEVVETGASDDSSALSWGLKTLSGLVFSKSDSRTQEMQEPEPEPTLPPGFSSIINAEEEEIYPAEVKIKVLVAEGNLSGSTRRQAADLHQALQQVVGAAAVYNHLLRKHGGAGTRHARTGSDCSVSTTTSTVGRGPPLCGCGGFVGSCKAISSLLREELDKVKASAESDRQGALLKKFRRVERRSGGLCSPDLLEKVVRSSSSSADTPPSSVHPPRPLPTPDEPPAEAFRKALALSNHKPPPGRSGVGSMIEVGLKTPAVGRGGFFTSLVPQHGNEGLVAASVAVTGPGTGRDDVPWADDMLCGASRRRNAAMLRGRGRTLAKGLARLLNGVSGDLQGVASRLPPWEEDEDSEDEDEDMAHRRHSLGDTGSHQSRSSFMSADALEFISSGRSSDPPIPSDVGPEPEPEPEPTVTSATTNVGPGDKGRARRLDWKLDAEELSLIRREEERVMKPDVLARLLAAGAKLECPLQQADFWDVFARLEVATRTEALLNIAIRGGRGCPARAGRMGRELCMSLTSVVLEAINTVEQDPYRYYSSQGRQTLRNDGRFSTHANHYQQGMQVSPKPKRPSSERLSRGQIAAEFHRMKAVEGVGTGMRSRAGSVGNGFPSYQEIRYGRGERVSGAVRSPVALQQPNGRLFKEDPGLMDLDDREEEFRKAIYVNRSSLANRFLQMTHDAPLCAKVLGNFVYDGSVEDTVQQDGELRSCSKVMTPGESNPPTGDISSKQDGYEPTSTSPNGTGEDAEETLFEALASDDGTEIHETEDGNTRTQEHQEQAQKQQDQDSGRDCKADPERGGSSGYGEERPSSPQTSSSSLSTEGLSEETDDTAGGDQPERSSMNSSADAVRSSPGYLKQSNASTVALVACRDSDSSLSSNASSSLTAPVSPVAANAPSEL